jgi:hypothetical protein
MPPMRRAAESQGQPQPAGIEPGPLEVEQENRALRDDTVRASMADQALRGRAEGAPELPPPTPAVPDLRTYRLLSGQFHQTLIAAAPVGAGETVFAFPEEISRGYLLVVRAIRVTAPPKSVLALFLNNVSPTSLIEVVNPAVLASVPSWGQVIAGPARILARITEAEAVGTAVVRLEGDLVPKEPVEV